MGRPREHDDETREALRTAAEHLFDQHGQAGVSVRAVAREVGTTTRAVYSLFGSRDGLLVDALAERAYDILERGLHDLPETDDPAADLIEAAVLVFRRFVCEHPALFRITFQRVVPSATPGPELLATRRRAYDRLAAKVERVEAAGLLASPVAQAVQEFQALCEGMGNVELRGQSMPMVLGTGDDAWRGAFTTLVRGMTTREGGGSGARRR